MKKDVFVDTMLATLIFVGGGILVGLFFVAVICFYAAFYGGIAVAIAMAVRWAMS